MKKIGNKLFFGILIAGAVVMLAMFIIIRVVGG